MPESSTSPRKEEYMNQSKKMVLTAYEALDEKKGMDIKVLDIHAQTGIADYFVICNGTSTPHTKALSDFVEEKVEKNLNERILRREGYQGGSWILLDYGVVIVQIFKPEERAYYNLEKLWGDSPEVDITPMLGE